MESNTKSDELVTIENNKALAKKCYQHIKDKKINIEEANINVFINDDVLLRFLVARDNDEKKAFDMWAQWADWRVQYRPELITEKLIENELKSGKAYLHGYDKEGRPCVVIKNCKHIPEKTDIEEFLRFFIYMIENACLKADL